MSIEQVLNGKYLDISLLIYISVSALVGFLIALTTYYWLNHKEQQKKSLLRHRDIEDPIEPDNNPINNAEAIARSKGFKSIEERFRVFRRFLIPLFIIVWALLVIIPTLNKVGGIYVSLLVGALSVIVGMAAKPWIENFIAGLVITLGQTIRVGDTIEIDQQYGIVEEIP